jgi:threonine/homoserine/homoserine lactone efflux protein
VLHIKPHHYLRQALTITLLNPKAIVFYMAFFPLFVDPARHQGLATFGFMAATIAALTFLYGSAQRCSRTSSLSGCVRTRSISRGAPKAGGRLSDRLRHQAHRDALSRHR